MSVNLFLVLFLLFNFSAQAAEVCQADRPKPLPPSNIYEIAQTTSRDDGVHRAFIPAFGTTRDGRIGLAKLANNPQSNQTGLNFFLLKPELVNGDFHRRPDGKPLLMVDYDNLNAVTRRISISQLRNKYGNSVIPSRNLMHTVICDHRRFKPHNLNNQDEYQFKVIAFEPDTNADRDVTAWTFGVRVRVKDPKTSRAEIDSIVLDDNYQKKVMKGLRVGLEPSITSDGKLMIVRTPLRYSYNPNPCNGNTWTDPKPLVAGRRDPNLMNSDGSYKYGLFKYPFRDSMGDPLTKMVGGYPWMDHLGNNLFYLALHRTAGRNSNKKIPFKCTNGGSGCNYVEDPGAFRGLSMIGLWTHGKATMVDGILNNTDYPASSIPSQQKSLLLYRGDSEGIRISGNRFNSNLRNRNITGVAYGNLSVVESLENKFNYQKNLAPSTPRDVVWKVTRGAFTDELVFDEYMDPNYLIYSQMVGAVLDGESTYYDGFQRGSNGCYEGRVRVQNAASSIIHKDIIPPYGTLELNDEGRIEPVALGGVHGKGLFLTRNNSLNYNLNRRTFSDQEVAYFSTFFDLRNSSGNHWFNLLKTPGGIYVQAYQNSQKQIQKFRLRRPGGHIQEFTFKTKPENGKWFHLGIVEKANNIWFIIDGNERVRISKEQWKLDLLGSSEGNRQLQIGITGPGAIGFNGWIDDVRLIADAGVYFDNPELTCNMARGSIVKRINGSRWQGAINRYNLSGHQDMFCRTKYGKESYKIDDALKGLSPSEFRSRREMFILNGDKLVARSPRPDFSENGFCLTCHTNDSTDRFRPRSLKIGALTERSVDAMHDPRRQPSQPPKLWNGFLPRNYFNSFNENQRRPARNFDDCGKQNDSCNIDPLLYD